MENVWLSSKLDWEKQVTAEILNANGKFYGFLQSLTGEKSKNSSSKSKWQMSWLSSKLDWEK